MDPAHALVLGPESAMEATQVAETARQALGESIFCAAWTAGRSMPPAQAVSNACLLVHEIQRASPSVSSTSSPPTHGLTRRELDVLHLLAGGCSDREIAETLFISLNTAKSHVKRIIGKVGVRSRSAAVAYAFQHDIFDNRPAISRDSERSRARSPHEEEKSLV